MSKIVISHNPYTLKTKILIDGSLPSDDSDIMSLIYDNQRIAKWIDNLPECLIEEYDEEEFEFEYYGIAEDYAVVKERLEISECVETIENKGGYYELDEAEETIGNTIKDIIEHYPDNEIINDLQKTFLENAPSKGNIEKRIERINTLVASLKEFINNLVIDEDTKSAKVLLDEKENSLRQEIAESVSDFMKKSQALNNVLLMKKVKLSDNAALTQNVYLDLWKNRIKSFKPKKNEYFTKGEFEEKNKTYAELLNGAMNDVNQSVEARIKKEIEESIINLNSSKVLMESFNTKELHIGENLQKLKLSHIKCQILNVDDVASDISDNEKALEKAKKAKKAAKIVGAVSAVAISPIGAAAAVATNAIAKNAANKNGINAYKFFMSLVEGVESGFDANTKAITDYYEKVTEIINNELSEYAKNAEEELNSQKEKFIEEKNNELDEIKNERTNVENKEKWLTETVLSVEPLNISKEEYVKQKENEISGIEENQFEMPVDDAFIIDDRGVVFVGTIEYGRIHMQDEVKIILNDGSEKTTTVIGIAFLEKIVDYAEIGDDVELLIKDFDETLIDKVIMLQI